MHTLWSHMTPTLSTHFRGTGEAEFNGVAYGRAEHEIHDPADTEYLKKVYKHEVEYLDLGLGRFFDWMKENGVYDNTVIILTSDHGEEFNEHGGFWHGTSLYGSSCSAADQTTSSTIENKSMSNIPWQVRSMDIAPTSSTSWDLSPTNTGGCRAFVMCSDGTTEFSKSSRKKSPP